MLFFTTLIREIVKDIEDFEGDTAYGRKTLPIVLGVFYTKVIIVVLVSITLGAIIFVYANYLYNEEHISSQITLWYMIVAQIIPFIAFTVKTITAKTKRAYSVASLFMKLVMLFGVLYSLVAGYIFLYTF